MHFHAYSLIVKMRIASDVRNRRGVRLFDCGSRPRGSPNCPSRFSLPRLLSNTLINPNQTIYTSLARLKLNWIGLIKLYPAKPCFPVLSSCTESDRCEYIGRTDWHDMLCTGRLCQMYFSWGGRGRLVKRVHVTLRKMLWEFVLILRELFPHNFLQLITKSLPF